MHIGDFLVKSMIEEAKTLDVVGMGITADNCNKSAVNLYTKHGFKKEGEAQFPYAYLDIFGLYF
jgi:ribosomal protein S18 acetylase RimI-like enzyme